MGSLQPGEAALRLVRQLAGGREGLPGPPALPAPAGVGHSLPHHVQLLARGECPPGPGAWAGPQAHRRLFCVTTGRGASEGRCLLQGLCRWLSGEELACKTGDTGDVVQSLNLEDPLEKETAAHSRIPWTEEPAGYSPWSHKRVGHD